MPLREVCFSRMDIVGLQSATSHGLTYGIGQVQHVD